MFMKNVTIDIEIFISWPRIITVETIYLRIGILANVQWWTVCGITIQRQEWTFYSTTTGILLVILLCIHVKKKGEGFIMILGCNVINDRECKIIGTLILIFFCIHPSHKTFVSQTRNLWCNFLQFMFFLNSLYFFCWSEWIDTTYENHRYNEEL